MNTAAVILARLKDDLKPFQNIKTDAGSFAERQLDRAAREVYEAKAWSFGFGSFELSTTEGVLEGYAIPDSVEDFDGLAQEERLSEFWAYDQASVPSVPDSSTGRRYLIKYNRAAGTLQFPWDPGTGTLTVYYRKEYGGTSTFSTWPDRLEFPVTELAKFYVLHNSPGSGSAKKAGEYFQNYERLLNKAWLRERRGHSKQEGREVYGVMGGHVSDAFQNGLDWD